jgi:beta-mannosidase
VVTVKKTEAKGRELAVTLHSTDYSHAVSLGVKNSYHLDDEFFDMLPGEVRTVLVKDAADKINEDGINPSFLTVGLSAK